MKKIYTVTVAMKQEPCGGQWLAQVHVEFHETKAKDVLRLSGDTPQHIMEKARNALDKRYKVKDGAIVLTE